MTVRHIIYQAKPSLIFGIVKSDILMSMINRVVSASNAVKTFQLNKICRISMYIMHILKNVVLF